MWKQKPKYFRIGFTAAVLAVQFLAFTTPALADPPTNNAPANNTQTKAPGATYVGRGVESSIRALLCAPTPTSNATSTGTGTFDNTNAEVKDNAAAGDLATCVNKGYRFALAFGAVASVFFVVLAGYMYMVGGEHGKEQAKEILVSVLAGFLIMLSSYVLLRQINPTLVAFRTIQPPQLLGKYELPGCKDLGLGETDECDTADSHGSNDDTISTGSKPGTAINCSGGIVDTPASIPHAAGASKLCKDLADQLAGLKAKTPGISWILTSSISGKHISGCHKTGDPRGGNCVDLALNGGRSPSYSKENGSTNPSWTTLCQAIISLGKVNFANEASKDPKCTAIKDYKVFPTTTGPNLHINYIGR